MTIRAEQKGRLLTLTVDGGDEFGIQPYIVTPASAKVGRALSQAFILLSTRTAVMDADQVEAMYRTALDGGTLEDDGTFVPNPDGTNYDRAENELSQVEATELTHKVFMWQSLAGMDGVTAYDEGAAAGNQVSGMVKSLRLLSDKLGLSPLLTSPSTVSENPMPAGATPGTTTHPSIARLDGDSSTVSRLPASKQSRKPKKQAHAVKST